MIDYFGMHHVFDFTVKTVSFIICGICLKPEMMRYRMFDLLYTELKKHKGFVKFMNHTTG